MLKYDSLLTKLAASVLLALVTVALYFTGPAFAKVPLAELGKNTVKLEVAQTRAQIEHGLMERASMPEDHGMVFIFHPKRPVRFWMFNCLMSLDMIFIDEGKIVKISRNVPPCKSHNPGDCPLYPDDGEVRASEVLEVNAGYCERHNIKEGDTIKFSLPGIKTTTATDQKK